MVVARILNKTHGSKNETRKAYKLEIFVNIDICSVWSSGNAEPLFY